MQARLDHGAVKLLTRTGLDWTYNYPAIQTLREAPAKLISTARTSPRGR